MWPRIVEVMLGLWLAISFLIFGYREPSLIIHDLIIAVCILCFSLLSYLRSCRKIHLMNILVSLWLIIHAYTLEISPAQQNSMVLGILFLMTAMLPSPSEKPPFQWRKFMRKRSGF